MKQLFCTAGFLTYSVFESPSRTLFSLSGKRIIQKLFFNELHTYSSFFIEKSLQQRVCSGFSPDSLLTFSLKRKNDPSHGTKIVKMIAIKKINCTFVRKL